LGETSRKRLGDRSEIAGCRCVVDQRTYRSERAVAVAASGSGEPRHRGAGLVDEKTGLFHFFAVGDDTARRRNAAGVFLDGEGGGGGNALRHRDRITCLTAQRSDEADDENEAAEGVTVDENRSQKGCPEF